ncbi:hypothetical protein [Mycobacterium intracellulare]|uniref:hypothetical protein n=1 Tax=Mycobacterium intracellulare TaxID=1767 RepID=UPI00259BB075|nr:hypothetical protein [Mycobacterium intracellulare]
MVQGKSAAMTVGATDPQVQPAGANWARPRPAVPRTLPAIELLGLPEYPSGEFLAELIADIEGAAARHGLRKNTEWQCVDLLHRCTVGHIGILLVCSDSVFLCRSAVFGSPGAVSRHAALMSVTASTC